MTCPRWLLSSLSVAIMIVLAAPCGAGPLPPPPNTLGAGVNFMKTQPPSVWDFGGQPIDEGTFGPGSDPFDGLVVVITDTKVWRGESTAFINDKAGVPVEIIAMTLHSVEPITVTFDGGERQVLYDVLVTLDPTTPSTGMYKVWRDPTGGTPDHGTILANGPGDPDPEPIPPDSFFDVFFEFEFTPRDPSGGDPAVVVRTDHLTLTADVPWHSLAPPAYAHPAAGDFYPGFGQSVAATSALGDPNVPQTLVYQGQHFAWHLRLEPVPEPATLALLAGGGLALLRRRKRTV